MLESLISYLDALIAPLGFRTLGLGSIVEREDVSFPAIYTHNGEYYAVQPEVSSVYHRVIEGPDDTDDPNDDSPVNNSIVRRTYTVRCVAIFPFDLYGADNQFAQDKAIRNLNAQLKKRNVRTLKTALKLIEVSAQPTSSLRGREAWEAEFTGIPWAGKMHIVSVDYTVVFRGFSDCIEALDCDDSPIDVNQAIIDEYCPDCEGGDCDDGTVSNSDDTYTASVASGGSLELPDITHTDSDGSTVTQPAQTPFVATVCEDPDPAEVTTNNDSPPIEVDAGDSFNINIHDSAGADVGTRSGGTVTVGDGSATVNGGGSIPVLPEGTTDIQVHDTADGDVGTLSGTEVEIGDADVNVNGADYGSVIAEGAIDVQVVNLSGTQVGSLNGSNEWEVDTGADCDFTYGAQPLRTGQTTSYETGDDGDLEKGFGASRLLLPTGVTNVHGNQNRFTNSQGGSTYVTGGAYIAYYGQDHATGLGWWLCYNPNGGTLGMVSTSASGEFSEDDGSTENWNDLNGSSGIIATINSGDGRGGFTDWRLPNIGELITLVNWSLFPNTKNYPPFNSSGLRDCWSSTTPNDLTTTAFFQDDSSSRPVQRIGKTTKLNYLICRDL